MERRIFAILCFSVLFAGCGAPQSAAGGSSLFPQPALGRHARGGPSWMLPQARKAEALLYVSDPGDDAVYVYSYPKGKLVGKLTDFDEPWGMCTDRAGNVYVADVWNYRLVEYAHGGTTPIGTLSDDDGHPMNCAVDPTTGDLAATYYFLNDPKRKTELLVYPRATGTPQKYKGSKIDGGLWACTFDTGGDLFVDGIYGTMSDTVGLAELRNHAKKLIDIQIGAPIRYLSGVQWAGQYLAMADQRQGPSTPATIYQLAIAGTNAAEVGASQLEGVDGLEQFWVQGGKVVAPSGNTKSVLFYGYPQGGPSLRHIGGLASPFSATVSQAAN